MQSKSKVHANFYSAGSIQLPFIAAPEGRIGTAFG
jgi:hypothetical protein